MERPESARPSPVLISNFSDLSNQRPIQSQIWLSSIVPGTSKDDDRPRTTSPARPNLGLSFPMPRFPMPIEQNLLVLILVLEPFAEKVPRNRIFAYVINYVMLK